MSAHWMEMTPGWDRTVELTGREAHMLLEALAGMMARSADPDEITAVMRMAQRIEGLGDDRPARAAGEVPSLPVRQAAERVAMAFVACDAADHADNRQSLRDALWDLLAALTGPPADPVPLPAEPPTYQRVERYRVSCLPDDHIEHDTFSLTVEYRGKGRWAVLRGPFCMDATGAIDYEPIPSSREDDWLDAHRFDLPAALALAHEHAPDVTINGHRAGDLAAAPVPPSPDERTQR